MEFSPNILTQGLPMPVEVGIRSGLCRIIFVLPVMQKQVVALVVLKVLGSKNLGTNVLEL